MIKEIDNDEQAVFTSPSIITVVRNDSESLKKAMITKDGKPIIHVQAEIGMSEIIFARTLIKYVRNVRSEYNDI